MECGYNLPRPHTAVTTIAFIKLVSIVEGPNSFMLMSEILKSLIIFIFFVKETCFVNFKLTNASQTL